MSEVMTGQPPRSAVGVVECGAQQAGGVGVGGIRDPWADDESEVSGRHRQPLTADEAKAVLASQPGVSPWRVVAVQVVVGLCLAGVAGLTPAGRAGALSMAYGMLVVVMPAMLMARGMTSRLSSVSPGVSAVSFMLWELVKIAVSVVLLMLAPRVVPTLNWLLMLVSVVVCMKVYWVALLWRGNRKS